MSDNLLSLQKKYGHLKRPDDHLIEGASGIYVKISTQNYFYAEDIVNLRTGERYPIKYDGWKIPYKKLFEVSKKMVGIPYSVKIPVYGRGYVLRSGTYRVAEVINGKLEEKRFSTVDKAIQYAKYLDQNNIKPELI